MFSSNESNWIWFLLILWAILLFGGFIFGKPHDEGSRRMPRWTRIASSFALVMAAWSVVLLNGKTIYEELFVLIAIGMTCGFIGDLFMAELIPIGERILGGIAAFGIGHIAYIIGLLRFGNDFSFGDDLSIRWMAFFVWMVVGAVGWFAIVYWKQNMRTLHWLALPYSLLLASTAGISSGLAFQSDEFIPMAIGAGLFLLSDLLIAIGLFREAKFPLLDDLVWLTYGPGQMLIVLGIPILLIVS